MLLYYKKVLSSWIKHNSDWNIIKLDYNNLKDYDLNINYIYNNNKQITAQALSDIIRVSILKKYEYMGRCYILMFKTNRYPLYENLIKRKMFYVL